jgi:hypothetical protein
VVAEVLVMKGTMLMGQVVLVEVVLVLIVLELVELLILAVEVVVQKEMRPQLQVLVVRA